MMTQQKEIYKCSICGNMVEVVHIGDRDLVCCGQPMEFLNEKFKDVGNEKHVPVIEKTTNGVKVRIGSIPHPMEETHYIQWIELLADDAVYRKSLKPGEKPEAEFCVSAKKIQARDYCNVHGLWTSR